MLSVVGVSARITIDEPIFQGAVDQDSEFASSGCHRLRFADAEGEPTVEGAEGGSAAAEVHGRQSQDRGSAIRRGLRATAQEATT